MEAVANTYTQGLSIADKINTIITQTKLTKADLANKINYSRATVSKYLNGKYDSDATELEQKLEEFLRKQGNESEQNIISFNKTSKRADYFESNDFINTVGLCSSCQENMALGILVGKSGFGKTHTLKYYSKMPRVAYIECDDTMACRDLVEAIEKALGIPTTYGTIWRRVNGIKEFFNVNNGYLLIIDEADKLISKYTQKKMEILRAIFDQSDVGMVIAGEPKLEAEIKSYLVRFANRMDFYYKLDGLNTKEVKEYLADYDIDEDALSELINRACNKQSGCFRLLNRTMNNVIRILNENGQSRVTIKTISQASNMMML